MPFEKTTLIDQTLTLTLSGKHFEQTKNLQILYEKDKTLLNNDSSY